MILRYLLVFMLVSCGQINLKGGTRNEVVTTGTTTHEIILKLDTSMCNGQEDVPDCVNRLTAMLEQFLETLNKTKEQTNAQIP